VYVVPGANTGISQGQADQGFLDAQRTFNSAGPAEGVIQMIQDYHRMGALLPQRAPTPQTIVPGRLALPASAFGRDAVIIGRRIDRTAHAIDDEDILGTNGIHDRYGSLYISLHGSGSLYEQVALPATALTGDKERDIFYVATAFPTTGAAQAAYRGDTSFLSTTWTTCLKPALVAVPGRYSTAACRSTEGRKQSFIMVTGAVHFRPGGLPSGARAGTGTPTSGHGHADR
jgi:hypothetical protein